MKQQWLFYIPFFVQAAVILFDEFFFHIKRGLPLWERIGHPLDTFSMVLCLSYVLVFPFSKGALFPFIVLGAISCLLITKDEFVHSEECEGKEHWLHALLFVTHPLVLISIGWLWGHGEHYRPFLSIQLLFVSLFCLYQLVYWNLVWKEKK